MICGSSSRGSATTASSPSASDATRNSGVSFESMKAAASRPAVPYAAAHRLLPATPGPATTGEPSTSAGGAPTTTPLARRQARPDLDDAACRLGRVHEPEPRVIVRSDTNTLVS